jgi:hypothetical protein
MATPTMDRIVGITSTMEERASIRRPRASWPGGLTISGMCIVVS